MRHRILLEQLGPMGGPMAEAVQACVHCGFCLPACPTYQVLGQEMDSPRGRIYLMKDVLEGQLDPEQALPHVDRCLGCLACETACPSGVAYHRLLGPFRERAEQQRRRGPIDRLRRRLAMRTLPYPRRFRRAVRLGRLAKPLRGLLPRSIRPMFDLLPDRLPPDELLPEVTPARGRPPAKTSGGRTIHGQDARATTSGGRRRARIALLAGCVQQVVEPQINRATIDVLARNGVEVLVPRRQGCCGALAWHGGEGAAARRLARVNLSAFPEDVDAIVTNAAGCGSGMRDYALMFRGAAEQDRAEALADRVTDAAVFLDKLGIEPPPPLPRPMIIAYQDACHLSHAQAVRAAPRRLLGAIPNLTLIGLPDGEMCCGSAGTYNLDQPDIAAELGRRKAEAVRRSGADAVASGNIGCIVQMRLHLSRLGVDVPVMHTMQWLHRAYAEER